jgi:glycosyltransferase involved in cell wall biosynthesis
VKQGVLIPLYNHGKTLRTVVESLAPLGLPIIVVDDGSDSETKEYLAKTMAAFPGIILVSLEKNRGKGRALSEGFGKARELGITHVLQVDADAQHDLGRAGFFLERSSSHPESLICSYPQYDHTVPASRKNGRKIANLWSHITTLSGDIIDALCGFRVYPVEASLKIVRSRRMDQRMAFETEILILFSWAGIPLEFFPIGVTYPKNGISHYRLVRDNIRMTWLFIRSFFGMLIRLPALLARGRRLRGNS